jgi:beta-glucosidase
MKSRLRLLMEPRFCVKCPQVPSDHLAASTSVPDARPRQPIRFVALCVFTLLVTCRPVARDSDSVTTADPLYPDATRSVDERVEDLLRRLTLDEKLSLVHADSKFTTAPIPRLGIPARQLSDGPHGVREEMSRNTFNPAGRSDDFSTWLPVGVALAATWNPELARHYGLVLGEEARARGKSVLLGPGVNIQRTPLGGRNFEYLTEDPFLAARIAVPWIQGLQSQHVAACVKHFALNNQEWERDSINVEVDERALREIYLPAFEAAVKEAGVLTIMGAYNQVRGQHACHNQYLLNTILKGEWGFRGAVISDWNGTHDTREAALNGLDLEMGTERPYENFYLARPFRRQLQRGEVPMSVLDDKVRRNLRVMFLTNAFDGSSTGAIINTAAHQDIARQVARESMV